MKARKGTSFRSLQLLEVLESFLKCEVAFRKTLDLLHYLCRKGENGSHSDAQKPFSIFHFTYGLFSRDFQTLCDVSDVLPVSFFKKELSNTSFE